MDSPPVIFACVIDAFDRILTEGAIYSKIELSNKGIKYQEHTTNNGIESILKTENDVTLFIDRTFRSGFKYGGLDGPRLIFYQEVLYDDSVYILPRDQEAYHPDIKGNLYERFEKDKHFSREEKNKLITEYMQGDGILTPEVHIPTGISIKWIKTVLLHHKFVESYRDRKELEHIKIIAVQDPGERKKINVPDEISYQEAYRLI